jgi:hypothetical protein
VVGDGGRSNDHSSPRLSATLTHCPALIPAEFRLLLARRRLAIYWNTDPN